MPDYNYSIFKLIRDKNGLGILKIARNFERETLAITRFKNHLNFSHILHVILKDNRVLPKRLRFNPSIKCQEGYDIAKKAGFAYLRLRISHCHVQIGKTALSYGFNFAITPTKMLIAEILWSVESGIKHLPPTSANLIRTKTVSILKGSKPSRQSNIKKDQLETFKALSKDPSVTILPADKGHAVVVIDSSDYQQKIYSLLQDENTYTKISDQRKNPKSSTEKTLNALLKQIKHPKSIHDPGAQQLDDKLYYKLRSTDATPATFDGLPNIHKPEVPLRPITTHHHQLPHLSGFQIPSFYFVSVTTQPIHCHQH